MKPKLYEPIAENASPYFGPQMLSYLCDTDEFIYRAIVYPLISPDIFDVLYNDVKSRPPIPPQICMTLMYLKEQYHLSRENVLINYRFNTTWQLATGTLYLGESIPGSDKTMDRFRHACEEYAIANGTTNPIDIACMRFTVMNCALAGIDGRNMRTDSTAVAGGFTVHSREELVFLSIKLGCEYITCSGCTEQVESIKACDRLAKYEDPNFTLNRFSERWPASTDKRREMLCHDADDLMGIYHMDGGSCNPKTTWEIVIEQQTKVEDGVRVFAEKGDEQLNSVIIQSLLDRDASYRIKNKKSQWGYVCDAVEAASEKAHFIIASCLYPNVTVDSKMADELNASIGPFFDQVDEVYAQYPALKKGDTLHCQAVVQEVIESMKTDFIAEGEKLHAMSLSHASPQELNRQLKRQMAILDTFYDRLGTFDPDRLLAIDEELSAQAIVADTDTAEEQKAPCSKAITDWSDAGAPPLDIKDPAFAALSDGERRNIILNKIASMNGFGSEGFLEDRNCVADGAYSPSINTARELGINMLTTNLLGRKGNPITMLFNLEGEKKTCPTGREICKTSVYNSGNICVWVKQDHCKGCPCCKDCAARFQKRGGMATIILKPNTFGAILSEAKILTDKYQKLADFRNGSEALMSLFHNFYKCDRWPIGMNIKRHRLKFTVMASNNRNLVLFIKGKTRVHNNPAVYQA